MTTTSTQTRLQGEVITPTTAIYSSVGGSYRGTDIGYWWVDAIDESANIARELGLTRRFPRTPEGKAAARAMAAVIPQFTL